MKNKSKLKLYIQKQLKIFNETNNFTQIKPTLFVRLIDEIPCIINIDISNTQIIVSLAIQPIFIPYTDYDLTFGYRLLTIEYDENCNLGTDNEFNKLEPHFDTLIELLTKKAIPWFDSVSTSKRIIYFLENYESSNNGLIVHMPIHYRNMILGYCYLYLNDINESKHYFNLYFDFFKDDNREWVINNIKNIKNILNEYANNQTSKNNIFDNIIKTNLAILKIGNYRK